MVVLMMLSTAQHEIRGRPSVRQQSEIGVLTAVLQASNVDAERIVQASARQSCSTAETCPFLPSDSGLFQFLPFQVLPFPICAVCCASSFDIECSTILAEVTNK